MKICLSRWCFMALGGAVLGAIYIFREEKSGFVRTNFITFTKVCEYCRKLLR